MLKKKKILMKKLKNGFAIILTVFMLIPASMGRAATPEVPEAVYTGANNASVMLNNMKYDDVVNSNTWAKEAIYESSALDIMKGYGDQQFGRTNNISKEQAIAIAYRMAGREAEAQKLGETLNNAKIAANKKSDAVSLWSDGYLKLAANEGLISAQDLKDAFTQDQTTLVEPAFHRDATAQRQDMAFWTAKVLKLAPSYGQQKIFNSYNDWKAADPIKVPYIEAILQNKVMNGNGNGNFGPTQPVTREQVAQIVKNAEGLIFPIMKYEKKTGTIENISSTSDSSQGESVTKNTFNIRNSGNGKLDQILTTTPDNPVSPNNNELTGTALPGPENDLVVYKNGELGNKELLAKGDKIEFIAGPDKSVKFVNVISSTDDTRYIGAQINSVDTANSQLNVTEQFGLTSNDLNSAVSFDIGNLKDNSVYRYSNDVSVLINNAKSDINSITPGLNTVLTIKGNTVTEIKNAEYKDQGVVNGIVEDNNPQLGYMTLYNYNGSGTSPAMQQQLAILRTFSIANPDSIEVYKNHAAAQIGDVDTGDTVFLRIGSSGNVESISAVDNYMPKYGRVITVKPSTLTVQYDDGTQQVLDVDTGAPVIEDKKLVGYSSIKDGDRVKLQLSVTNKFTKVKEISIEGEEHLISNIYKGTVNYIDDTSNSLVVQDLMTLNQGQWERADQKGITGIVLASDYNIYSGNKIITASKVNSSLRNNEAYIAVEKDYGGNEQAVLVAFRNANDTETLLDDSVVNSVPGSGQVSLSKGTDNINYNNSTIVIKDGRLVTGNSIVEGNSAYIVANRSDSDGETYAGIVQIGDRSTDNFINIYRGRIKQINASKDFTVESFSQLDGMQWDYANTPKTFKLVSGTRILDKSGVVGQRSFLDKGTTSYKGQTVYILSSGVNADLISTVSYGVYNVQGVIDNITGMTIGSTGAVLQEPTGFSIQNTSTYDLNDFAWVDSNDMTLNILKNSIILKNNKIAKPSDLKKGDKVRVIRKDGSAAGDAYIIMDQS